MLMPKKVKHRKVHRGRRTGKAKGGSTVKFGEYGLQALQYGWVTNRQIEAAREAMRLAAAKLPIKVRFTRRIEEELS